MKVLEIPPILLLVIIGFELFHNSLKYPELNLAMVRHIDLQKFRTQCFWRCGQSNWISSFEVFTSVFKKIKIFWDIASLDCCAVTDVSKKLDTSVIRVVQKECHNTDDLNHYRYLYKKNITLQFFTSVFNQLDAQNLFHDKFYFMPLHVSSTCAHHQEVKIALHSLWYHHT